MCENMEDQSGRKEEEDDESAEMMRNNERDISMEANILLGEMADEENQKKRIRHRRRKIYENIRNKMEFYFSDANLAKDRFLSKLLENNPGIELAIFLRFNKIRELTDNVTDIKNSLKHSDLLSVTEDGTRVFRTKPIQLKENEDDCTIYVEKLPLEANHDWLMQVFSQYGTVDYVSIPKYRSTGKIKGFAFVEFHTPEEAQNTLEAFGAAGCCLSSNIEPEKLCSVATFENEENDGDQVQQPNLAAHGQKRAADSGENDDVEVIMLEEQDGDNKKTKKEKKKEKQKRKRSHSSDQTKEKREDTLDKGEKKDKNRQKHVEDVINLEDEEEVVASRAKKERKEKKKHTEVTTGADGEEEQSGEDQNERKRKRKHSEISVKSEEEVEDTSGKGKKEKHVDAVDPEKSSSEAEKSNKRKLQVEEATVEEGDDVPEKKIKIDSENEKKDDTEAENGFAEDEFSKKKKSRHRKKKKRKQIAQEVSSLGLQVLSKKEWKRLRNKYLNLQRLTMKNLKQQLSRTRKFDMRSGATNGFSQHSNQVNEVPSGDASDMTVTAPRFSYTPGVIVHIKLDAPVTDVKKFKTEAKSHGDVQYVDIHEGATEVFLRCSNAEAAEKLASAKPWPEMDVLGEDEDKQYWERIQEDRHKMVNVKKKKKRGKDKLLARAEKALSKHIKFDETV